MFGVFIFLSIKRIDIPEIAEKISGISMKSIYGYNSLSSIKVYQKTPDNWILDPAICPKIPYFPKTTLCTPAGNTTIYLYENNEDPGISVTIRLTGSFQPEVSEIFCKLIASEATSQYIDIGANLGAIALSVAKCAIGKPVFAVEPVVSNIQRLCHSVKDGNFTDQITLLQTALSNKRRYVNLGYRASKGGARVLDKKDVKQNTVLIDGTVMAATLDDMLSLPGFQKRKTFIKIDVDGHEYNVLDMGRNFFDVVDVRAVMVEWILLRNQNETAKKIIEFFKERKFTPYNFQTSQILTENVSNAWPHDVLWKPNTT